MSASLDDRGLHGVARALPALAAGLAVLLAAHVHDPEALRRAARAELGRGLAASDRPWLTGRLAPPYDALRPRLRMRGHSDGGEATPVWLRAAAERLIAGGEPRDAAVAHLLTGDAPAAVRTLTEAIGRGATPSLWVDLSAAQIALCESGRDYDHCVDALDAADLALALDAHNATARFNRAAALEHLGLVAEAGQEWTRSAAEADDAVAAGEARQNASRLAVRPGNWKAAIAEVEAAAARGDADAIDGLVRAHPRDSRAWAENVYLPAAVSARQATEADAEARKALETARRIGVALERFSGERMVVDAAAAIESAKGDRRRAEALAVAYAAYTAGRMAHRDQKPVEAERLLFDAETAFHQAGSPMAFVARYYAASALYMQSRVTDAAAVLDELAALHFERRGYRALAAQIGWERGLTLLLRGRYSDALTTFEDSAQSFATLGEDVNRASIEDFLADTMEFLGDPGSAWSVRRNALETFSRSGSADREIHSLTTAVAARIRRREWRRALPLLNLSIELATGTRSSALAASALSQRSIVWNALAEQSKAAQDLAEAKRWLGTIRDPAIARRVTAEQMYAEARLAADDPELASAQLTRALNYFRVSGAEVFEASTLLERARAQRRLGHTDAARQDLADGLRAVEEQRAAVSDLNQRAAMFAAANDLFAESIDLALASGDDAAAFALTERARGRALLDLLDRAEMGALRLAASPLSLSALQEALAPDAAIVEYRLQDHRLAIFIVRGDGLRTVTTRVAAAELGRLAGRCTRSLRSGPEPSEAACGPAKAILFAPAAAALAGIRVVAVVPDPALAGFPFGAVAGDGLAVVEAPSATLAVHCSRNARVREGKRALVVAATQFDRRRFAVDPLRNAAAEAEAVAVMRPDTQLLDGAQVTKERLQRELGRAAVFHFAGHAVENAVLRTESRLVIASMRAEDDLTAADIAAMQLGHTSLAYLSACRSAAAGGNADGVENLALAFLAAGVPTIVAARWDIDDAAAAKVAVDFHRALIRGGDAATALAGARSLQRTDETLRAGAALTVVGGTLRLVN